MCYSNCKYENWHGNCQIGNRNHFPQDAHCVEPEEQMEEYQAEMADLKALDVERGPGTPVWRSLGNLIETGRRNNEHSTENKGIASCY